MDKFKEKSYDELLSLVTSLQKEIKELSSEYEKLENENQQLKLVIAMKNARTFKPKSESIDKEEINLFNFNEIEANASTSLNEETRALETKKPRKAKAKNHEGIDFESMVSETVIHEDHKCDHETKLISEDITYKAEVKMDIRIIKHIFKTRKCDTCSKVNTQIRDFPFSHSIATPSLVSYIANEKFFMGTPLYRQENAFLNAGFPISRVNLSNYLMKAAALIKPFYVYLKHLLIHNKTSVIHADETTLKVINVGHKAKRDKSYVWMYASSIYDAPIYIYEYRYSRSGAWPRDFLKDYKGYLVVDDYAGYNHIPNVTLQKCFVHAKRKFVDIYKANKDPKLLEIIDLADKIFKAERGFRDNKLSPKDIHHRRNQKSYHKLLDGYFNHLKQTHYSPNSVTGKAVAYSLKLERELKTYLKSGHIPIDNNLAERGVKPFVINRKNFLFSNTEKGARASTILMSIITTAKTNGLDTYKYLAYLMDELYKLDLYQSQLTIEQLEKMNHLLPWKDEIKSMFKVKEVAR
ncbi:IS66 family transposase [Hujiaoplasma nucleasis]|uniref:IS66 family transposase n=1 Tax=Hujiaoplasma nucleasis TaxID=2725268 RepID=A0A7L6N2S4_9MOLU|nr:IS66 family transposase [Hujiaoplasma nucleasis]QLY39851.1 IS66 family transposase [Hujiaoplasma nucleasis]